FAATKAGFIVLLPVSVAMCGTSKEIFLLLVGEKYDFAWIYMGILVFAMAAYTLYLSASIIIIASNHPEYPLKNVSILLVSAFVLNWIFMKLLPFNVFGMHDDPISRALAGPVVAIIVGLIGTWFFGRWIVKAYGVFARWIDIARISLACLIPAPILWFLNLTEIGIDRIPSPWQPMLGMVGEYLIYFLCYSILLFVFGAFDSEEKGKILKLLNRIRRKESDA
ncbi:MAG: hypothetical protein ABIC40_01270, partial [bacterium]